MDCLYLQTFEIRFGEGKQPTLNIEGGHFVYYWRVRDGFVSDGYDSGVQDICFFECLWCFHVGLLLLCSFQGRFYFIFQTSVLLQSGLTLWYLENVYTRESFLGSVGHFGFSTFFAVLMRHNLL